MSAHTELPDLVLHSMRAVNEDPIEMFLEDVNLRGYVGISNSFLSLNN